MKKISNYIFSNNKREIATYYLSPKAVKEKKIHKHDCIALRFDAHIEDDYTVYMRPDEALLVAELLIDTVFKTTKAFNMGLLKKRVKGIL